MSVGAARDGGSALIVAMVLVVVAAGLASSIQNGSRLLMTETLDERAALQALQAADGGIELARWGLRRNVGYLGESIAIGDAAVEVAVEEIEAGVRWRVRSTARVHPAGPGSHPRTRTLEAELVTVGPRIERDRWWQRR